MDMATHAGIGLIGAAALLPIDPIVGMAFAFGSVAPDLDAMTRIFGARRFLELHQTWTHALPIQAGLGCLLMIATWLVTGESPMWPLAVCVGMAIHSGLDALNTYGIALLLPWIRKRYHADALFFIDTGFWILIAPALAMSVAVFLGLYPAMPAVIAIGTGGLACGYLVIRWSIARRIRSTLRSAGFEMVSTAPSALCPWHAYVVYCRNGSLMTGLWNQRTRAMTREQAHEILDPALPACVERLPAWRFMRSMSPAYHAISVRPADGGRSFHCADLRIRNFGTRFGSMIIHVNDAGESHVSSFNI